MDNAVLSGNKDTGLLKIIAFITMLADHVGYLFFPEEILWRIIGRVSFPLFAYCLVLGFFHTRDIKKYFLRLLGFSLISQIPYTLCFNPYDIIVPIWSIELNIGFTMMLGLWAIWGIEKKKYIHTAAAVLLSFVPTVEYGFYGVAIMIAAYLFAKKDKESFGYAVGIALGAPFFKLFIDGTFDPQGFALLALPLILLNTNSGIKIPRWLNYGFYPAHLCVLAILNHFI